MSRSSPPNIITVHQHDVLFGRGGKNCKHAGNQRLRAVARSYKNTYSAATKKGKSDISRSIIAYFRGLDPPGRFLKKDDATGLWVEVKEEVAREKASQTLRDARDDPTPVDGDGIGDHRQGHHHGDSYYEHHHQSSGYCDDEYYHHPPHAVTSSWDQPPNHNHHHHNHHYERPSHHHHHHLRHSGHESWRHHHPAAAVHHHHRHDMRDVRLPILDGRRAKVWIRGGNRDRNDSEEDASSYSHRRNENRIVLPLGGGHCRADAEVEAYVGGGGGRPLSHEDGTEVQVEDAKDGYDANPSRKRRYHQAIQDDHQEQAFRVGDGPNRSSSSDYDEDNGVDGNRMTHQSNYYHTVTPPENVASGPSSRYNNDHNNHQTDESLGRFYEQNSNSEGPGSRPPSVPIEPSHSFEYAPNQAQSSSHGGGGCDEVRPSGGGSGNTAFSAHTAATTSGNHHVAFPTPDSHCPVSSSAAPAENWAKNEAGGGDGGEEWNDGYEYVERYSSSSAGAMTAHH